MRTEGDNDVGYCSLFVLFRIDYLLHPRDTYRYHFPTFFPPPPRALFSSSIPHTLQPYLCPSSLETQTWMAFRLLFVVFNPSDLSQTLKLLFSEPCTRDLGGYDKTERAGGASSSSPRAQRHWKQYRTHAECRSLIWAPMCMCF